MSQGGVSILDTCEQRGRHALYKLPYGFPEEDRPLCVITLFLSPTSI